MISTIPRQVKISFVACSRHKQQSLIISALPPQLTARWACDSRMATCGWFTHVYFFQGLSKVFGSDWKCAQTLENLGEMRSWSNLSKRTYISTVLLFILFTAPIVLLFTLSKVFVDSTVGKAWSYRGWKKTEGAAAAATFIPSGWRATLAADTDTEL